MPNRNQELQDAQKDWDNGNCFHRGPMIKSPTHHCKRKYDAPTLPEPGGTTEASCQKCVEKPTKLKLKELVSIWAVDALIKFPKNKSKAAEFIKQNLDEAFGKSWCCFMGKNFGSSFDHYGNYISMDVNEHRFLAFRSSKLE